VKARWCPRPSTSRLSVSRPGRRDGDRESQALVEHGRDVVILLDSITRSPRLQHGGAVLRQGADGGLSTAEVACKPTQRGSFGAARNIRRKGGSLTINTATSNWSSKPGNAAWDEVKFEEYQGAPGQLQKLILDRKGPSDKAPFPAIDINRRSGHPTQEKKLSHRIRRCGKRKCTCCAPDISSRWTPWMHRIH